MKLHSTYNHASGFSLIELMIGLGLLVFIMSLGLFLSMDVYRSYAFKSEQETILNVLHRARMRSLSNINQTSHGVHFQADRYVLFEGPVFISANPTNEEFAASSAVAHSPTSLDIVFNQLTGNSSYAGSVLLVGQG
ncbi:MAG: prepilin-type N-terminal cleavage/methylation domain-containing protein, partial [Patescibacteria group bacterium]